MSLQEVSLRAITFKQYVYKLKGYSNLFYGLLLAQNLGVLFSMQGVLTVGFGFNDVSVTVKGYSADIVIVFSLFAVMITGATIASKSYRNIEFSLVANRLSSNLSNLGFLLTFSILGGITASLCGVLLRFIGYFKFVRTQTFFGGFLIAPSDLLMGMFVSSLCLLLLSSFGYLWGTLIEWNKSFVIITPIVMFGLLRVDSGYLGEIFKYFFESSLLLFIVKMIIQTLIFFGISVLLSNRLEVRK